MSVHIFCITQTALELNFDWISESNWQSIDGCHWLQ